MILDMEVKVYERLSFWHKYHITSMQPGDVENLTKIPVHSYLVSEALHQMTKTKCKIYPYIFISLCKSCQLITTIITDIFTT